MLIKTVDLPKYFRIQSMHSQEKYIYFTGLKRNIKLN